MALEITSPISNGLSQPVEGGPVFTSASKASPKITAAGSPGSNSTGGYTPEFAGQIPFFLQSFLSRPASALPKGAQWLLTFNGAFISGNESGYTEVLPVQAIKKGIKYEPRQWNIDKALDTLIIDEYQKIKGCMFVQAVQIPGESNQANPEGLQQNGFIRTTTGNGRDAFQNLQIVFLETNVSFVDNLIRPWVIATSHLGMIARKGPENYRCNISVYKLGVMSQDKPPFILQKYTFFGACPISVSGEEYNYTQTGNPVNRETTFIYHYYNMESVQGNLAISNNSANIPVPLSTPVLGKNVNVALATKA